MGLAKRALAQVGTVEVRLTGGAATLLLAASGAALSGVGSSIDAHLRTVARRAYRDLLAMPGGWLDIAGAS